MVGWFCATCSHRLRSQWRSAEGCVVGTAGVSPGLPILRFTLWLLQGSLWTCVHHVSASSTFADVSLAQQAARPSPEATWKPLFLSLLMGGGAKVRGPCRVPLLLGLGLRKAGLGFLCPCRPCSAAPQMLFGAPNALA